MSREERLRDGPVDPWCHHDGMSTLLLAGRPAHLPWEPADLVGELVAVLVRAELDRRDGGCR